MKDILQTINRYSVIYPNKIAIRYNDHSLTYKQLDTYANALACYIMSSRTPLILYGHMSPYMIVGMLASLKAGCGYIPLDISMPSARLQHIINKVEPNFVLNTTSDEIELTNGEIITIDDLQQMSVTTREFNNIQEVDIAYTIFTSGTTGEPKGVQISYGSLNEFVKWISDINQLGLYQHWLNQAPFSFDLSVMAIYPCLTTAGTLHLVDKHMVAKPQLLDDLLRSNNINIWVSTPSFMELALLLPVFTRKKYESLGQFIFCGEVLSHKLAEKLLHHFNKAVVYNTYGPTEATVAVTGIQITQSIIQHYNPLPVGKPRAGVTLAVNDHAELIIMGRCLSQGYLNDAIKTAQVFKEYQGKQAYYTGDSAYYLDDMWFIKGRMDNQIKYNGYRIELEDIEFRLRQIHFIQEAIVVPKVKQGKVVQLIAAITLTKAVSPEEVKVLKSEITPLLAENLPTYMLPTKYEILEKLPINGNGKVDRKAINEVILR